MARAPGGGVRGIAFVVVFALASLVAAGRLGVASWRMDELIYRESGMAYVRGDLALGHEYPPLGKYVYGLAATLGGPDAGTVRLPAALANIGTGLLLFTFGRHVSGFWAGLVAFAVFALPPCTASMAGVAAEPIRIDRLALLDPIMGFFLTLALWLGWRWREEGGVRRAAATGLAVGLAATAKMPGVLVAPVIVGAVLWQRRWRAVGEGAAFVAALVGTVALVYAPFGRAAPAVLLEMVEYQAAHRASGHPAIVAGTFYLHPPWWALLSWYRQGSGTATAAGFAGALAASFVAVAPAVRWYLVASIAAVVLFLTVVAGVALPHYAYDWQAPSALLAGLALVGLWRRGGTARAVAAALALLLAAGAATTGVRLARLAPADYHLAGETLVAAGLGRARTLVLGYPTVARAYLPDADIVTGDAPAVDVVLLDSLWASRYEMPGEAAALRTALPELAECRFDRLRVYVRTVPPGSVLAARCTRPATLPPPTPGSLTGF